MSAVTEQRHYQGWANYPTWAVNLWMANDHGMYSEACDMAQQALVTYRADDESPMRKTLTLDEIADATTDLADMYRNWITELSTLDEASFRSDILGWALECVDWREIAASWIEDVES